MTPEERLRSIPSGSGSVRLELHRAWAEIVLDHPAKRNAVSPGMMLELRAVVEQLESWPGGVVLVRGEGEKAFCSGGDLAAVQAHLMKPDLAEAMSVFMSETLHRLAHLPQMTMAAVDGAALGGGAEILMHLDRVTMAQNAVLGFVHSSLGVSPGWGGGCRLIERVGQRLAMQVLVEGRRLPAQVALELGLVDRVVSASAVTEARAYLTKLTRREAHVIRGAVSLCRTAESTHERDVFLSLWGGPSHLAALERVKCKD